MQRSADAVKTFGVKRFVLPLAVVAGFAAMLIVGQVQGQTEKPAAAVPTKIGLVDMARVFKEYEKFARLREDLEAQKGSLVDSAKQAKAAATKIAEEMKQFGQDSDEYRTREERITKLSTEFETRARITQRDLARKEAEIFETVYVEASDVIARYAKHFNYTLILRFNSEQIDAENPQKLANGLNKLVLYNRPQDDITDPVVEALNREFAKKAGPAAGGPKALAPRVGTGKEVPRN